MGESQGAEDCLGGEGGEEPDEDEAGSRMREEVSIVALSRDSLNLFSHFHQNAGVKRERANAAKLSSKYPSCLPCRKHVIPLQTKR